MNKRNSEQPPSWAFRFVARFLNPTYVEELAGDLEERFQRNLGQHGRRKARWRYVFGAFKLLRPALRRHWSGDLRLTRYGMLENYMKVGARNIMRHKAFSLLNAFGLAVSMAVGLLIILMLNEQTGLDEFHSRKDRIYQINTRMSDSWRANASSPVPLADHLQYEHASVEKAVSLVKGVGGDLVSDPNQTYAEVRGFFTDQRFFEVFDFNLIAGSRRQLLEAPNQVVITTRVARQLFENQNPIGQSVQFSDRQLELVEFELIPDGGHESTAWGTFMVVGVIDLTDTPSHLVFDVLISRATMDRLHQEGLVWNKDEDWNNHSMAYTYALLQQGTSTAQLQSSLDRLSAEKYSQLQVTKHLIANALDEVTLGNFLGNPPSLHLPIEAYYSLVFMAFVVLGSAFVNYTNLSIARASTRAKEIGIRKVNGASRASLVNQFIVESILISLLAVFMANFLVLAIRPSFLNLWAVRQLQFDLQLNGTVLLWFLAFAIVCGLLAGLYPSLILSKYSPLRALKKPEREPAKKLGFRKALSILQFVLSLLFITSALLIDRQFRHFMHFDHGMSTSQVLNVALQGNDFELLKKELNMVPGVESVAASQILIATPNGFGRAVRRHQDEQQHLPTEFYSVDTDLVVTLGLGVAYGSNIAAGGRGVLINEFGARALGFEDPATAVGESLEIVGLEQPYVVSGVLADFKFQTPIMGEGNKSLILHYDPELFRFMHVKVNSADSRQIVELLIDKWEALDPIHPFDYQWYQETLVASNQWLGDLSRVIGFIAFLAICISCLGLLGMTIYTTERRMKEVSIRKILGAEVWQIALLLGRSFGWLLAISIAIAGPLSFLINKLWLDSIPNRIDVGPGTILIASAMVLALGLLAIGSQIISVSRTNPVETLKDE
ncbi:MAG: ABC transporter permease [Bacteroidota bacterium]